MEINERIIKLCKDAGIPVSKVEKDLGFSNGYIKRTKNPSIERLGAMSSYLGVSTSFLVTGEGDEEVVIEATKAQLIAIYDRMSTYKKGLLIRLAKELSKEDEDA